MPPPRKEEIIDALIKKHDGSTQDAVLATKTTLTAVKADTDIADAIARKHIQNADTGTSAINFAISGTNAVKEGDARLSDARTPLSHNQAESTITNLVDDLAAKETPAGAQAKVGTHNELVSNVHGVGAGTIAKTADITKTAVGLGNCDNTADTAKPVSTAQQTALDGKEPANANIQAHVISAHAASNAQKNSDITKAEIEAKLIGELTSHSHAGGSGVDIKQTEIDFGATLYQVRKTFTITDAGVALTNQLIASMSLDAPTGRDADEVRIQDFSIKCASGTGQFDMEMNSLCGDVNGKFKVNYLIG